MGKRIEFFAGQRFGRLVVMYINGRDDHRNILWLCKCDCGNEISIPASSLKNININSCGCLRDQLMQHNEYATKHGHNRKNKSTTTYNTWVSMTQRCHNTKRNDYKYYGGRGIKVCSRWRNSFEDFLADMGERPDGMTLDRINNDGDYKPVNCRWASIDEQCRNKSNNRMITIDGITKCLFVWCKILNLNYSTVYSRITTKKWPVRQALELE